MNDIMNVCIILFTIGLTAVILALCAFCFFKLLGKIIAMIDED